MNTTWRYDTRQMPGSTSPSLNRRTPLLQRSLSMSSTPKSTCAGSTAAEFCGGTTASCAAVWCCCPCGLVNLLVLAIYKVPAGLCRRALRHRRRKNLIKSGIMPHPAGPTGRSSRNGCRCSCGDSEFAVHPLGFDEDEEGFLDLKIIKNSTAAEEDDDDDDDDEAVRALEKEMWNRFYGAGFWRSPSQRETVSSPRVSKSSGMLRGSLQRESSVAVTEAAAAPSPRTSSFTGIFRNASMGAAVRQ